MLLQLYRTATRLGAPLVQAHLRRRLRLAKEDPGRLGERLGRAGAPRPAGALVWLHGASVGEALTVLPVADVLLAARPALEILLTTGTVTSARAVAGHLPPRVRHQYVPVDLPGAWRSFLDHWRPDLALLVESELWPNLIAETRARRIPMALLNARLSERSHRRWMRAPGMAKELLAAFEICLAQSAADGERLRDLGARRVHVAGNLKHAAAPLPFDPFALDELRGTIGGRPVWLAASTHPGEEELMLDVHRRVAADLPGLLTIIAPRHPERGDALAHLIRERRLIAAQRSRGEAPSAECEVYLADTIGELGLLYRTARVAFIGRSLVEGGGHNPLEAARLGCPPLLGPHTGNFGEITEQLLAKGAAQRVANADQLAEAVVLLLVDPQAREELAARARALAERESGALPAVLDTLAPVLERALGPPHAGA
jgi:3-deoxy-D-manno-octulosonic-acid transferase